MKLKYLVLTWILVEVLCFVGVARATCEDTTFYVNDSYYGTMVESSQRKTVIEKTDPPAEEKSYHDLFTVIGYTSISVFFVFFLKYSYLSLELVSYQKFWDHEYDKFSELLRIYENNRPESMIRPNWKNYPVVNPMTYLFNFKKWHLKQILDPFTYDTWIRWVNDQSRYDIKQH